MAVMGCGRLGGVVLSPKMVRCWMGLLAGVGAAGLGRRSNFVATAGVLTPINGWWIGGGWCIRERTTAPSDLGSKIQVLEEWGIGNLGARKCFCFGFFKLF